MKGMDRYDVVVIGAGLAGLETARRLGKHGLRVLLADRKASLTEGVSTTGIFVRRTLEDFDIPEDCLGPAIGRVKLYSPERRVLVLESLHDEFRVGRMGRLYVRWLERCLRARVRWSPQTRLLSVEPETKGSVVHLERLGRRVSVRTRFLVGADGARSRVARSLGLDENREFIFGIEDVLESVPAVCPVEMHCFLDPRIAPGYLAWYVNDGREAHIGTGGYANHFQPARALHEFRESLGTIADLSQAVVVERRAGWIPVGGILRRISNSHGLLVGDAAGAPSPLTAGGLDPCLRLSRFAAQSIFSYLSTGDEKVLRKYSGANFHTRFLARMWMRRLLASLPSRPAVEIACAVMRLPGARALARHVFFGRGSFPDAACPGVAMGQLRFE